MITGIIKIEEGIPFFSPDRYWGKAPEAELRRALEVLTQDGWNAFKKEFEGRFDFTFEENRADWRFNIPVAKTWKVLDAGAGMGRISIPLARVTEKVVAVDQSFLRMKFLKKRAEQEHFTNIETYVGDVFDLPFKDEFDLIVMNGLLEWVGKTDRYTDPRQAQVEALSRCRRMLKPGGHLYIGIENRYALAYLRARDHSGLRYTSYMPRWMANLYTKLRKGERYATYTYNVRGYQQLLRDAGFGTADFYLVYPGYNAPRITIPYKNLGLLSYVIRTLMPGSTWKQRLAKVLATFPPALALYRKLFFSFNIFVQK